MRSTGKLLALLAEDAGQRYADLAAKLNLSAPALHDRVRKLKARGVIRGTMARLDPKALDRGLAAFIHVDTGAWTCDAIADALEPLGAVEEVHSVAGSAALIFEGAGAHDRGDGGPAPADPRPALRCAAPQSFHWSCAATSSADPTRCRTRRWARRRAGRRSIRILKKLIDMARPGLAPASRKRCAFGRPRRTPAWRPQNEGSQIASALEQGAHLCRGRSAGRRPRPPSRPCRGGGASGWRRVGGRPSESREVPWPTGPCTAAPASAAARPRASKSTWAGQVGLARAPRNGSAWAWRRTAWKLSPGADRAGP